MKSQFRVLVLVLCLAAAGPAHAQEAPTRSAALFVSPQALLPVGTGAEYFATSYGARACGLLALERIPWLQPRLDLSYAYVPMKGDNRPVMSLVRGSLGPQATAVFGEGGAPASHTARAPTASSSSSTATTSCTPGAIVSSPRS